MLLLLICALILNWPPANALALEPREADLVPIGTVLADPQHYNLKTVRFQGTITGMTILPLQGGCGTIDAYLFQFEDGTGSIQIYDNGWCVGGRTSVSPILVLTPAQIGERISVTTIVKSPTYAPGLPIQAKLRGIGKSPERLP